MTDTRVLLAVDAGTSSIKTVAFALDGTEVAEVPGATFAVAAEQYDG